MQRSWTALELGQWCIGLLLVSGLGDRRLNYCSAQFWLQFDGYFCGSRLLLFMDAKQVESRKTSLNVGKSGKVYHFTVRSGLLQLFDHGTKLFSQVVFVLSGLTIKENCFACNLLLRRRNGCQQGWRPELKIWCSAVYALYYFFGFLGLNEFVF